MLRYMSFEEEKQRLIQELADAQTQTRAKYGMKPKPQATSSKDETPKQGTPAKA